MMNKIILNHDSVADEIHAAMIRAILSTHRPSVSGVVASGRDKARAIIRDVRIDWSIYRSK